MRWWNLNGIFPKTTPNRIVDVYGTSCVALLSNAFESGKPIYRFVASSNTITEDQFGTILTGSLGIKKFGGSLIFIDEAVENISKAALYSWDESICMLSFDHSVTETVVEFCSNDYVKYVEIKNYVSGALHP